MAQYYTLDEAARVLQTTPDVVRKMADDKKLRSFRDKGTLRFRAQEIDELAREMGLGSDPDLQLGEVPQPKKGASPNPAKRPSKIDKPSRPSKLAKPSKLGDAPEAETFDFSLSLDEEEEQVQLGSLPPRSASSSKSGSKKSRLGPPVSPAPKPGSDSGVRLVPDAGEVDFDLPLDDAPAPPPTPSSRKKSKLSKLAAGPDSGVRIVPLDPSDSDVKMVHEQGGDDVVSLGGNKPMSASDSDIRLEQHTPGKTGRKHDPEVVTEEIDLDAEMSKHGSPTPPPKPRPSAPQLPTSSPFELSEEDLGIDDPAPIVGRGGSRDTTDSSGDFELTPGGDMSPLELGSDEMPALNIDDEEVSLGDLNDSSGGGGSGINLRDPADSGISLEQEGSDEIDLDDLSLDAGATPGPHKGRAASDDSDSEFELSLDDDESSETINVESSEFELSLDDSGSSELELDLEPADNEGGADSDSEFELTLDDSSGSSALEDSGEEKDIFETDFEVPALEEESGSEALALDEDTDLESSEFDLAIDEMDVGAEDESASQVVALEEDEFDIDPDAPPKPKRKTKLAEADEEDDGSEFSGIGPVEGEEDDETAVAPGKGRIQYVEKQTAPWGPVPAMLMLPCIIVLFIVGLMGFELIQGMQSYQKTGKFSGMLIGPLTKALTGEDLPGGKK